MLSACQTGGTRPIIKIGLTAPFTGFDESVGYSVIGAVRLAVRERNLQGGVAGYSVELVALDDGNEPGMAAQRAREMAIDPAVMAVLGGFDVATAEAAASEYGRNDIGFVTFAADALEGNKHVSVFRLVGTTSEVGRRAGEFATHSLAAKRIAVIGDGAAESNALVDAFVAASQAGGATIVLQLRITRWQLDFVSVVQQIIAVSPNLVFFAGRAAEAGELLKQMRAAGVTAVFLGGPGVDDARLAQIAGPAAEGVYYVSPAFSLSQVSDPTLRERLQQASLRPAGPYTVLAYDGTHVLLDALARAIKTNGRPTRAAVAQALRATRYQGASGEIAFDEQGNRQNAPGGVYQISSTYPGALGWRSSVASSATY